MLNDYPPSERLQAQQLYLTSVCKDMMGGVKCVIPTPLTLSVSSALFTHKLPFVLNSLPNISDFTEKTNPSVEIKLLKTHLNTKNNNFQEDLLFFSGQWFGSWEKLMLEIIT